MGSSAPAPAAKSKAVQFSSLFGPRLARAPAAASSSSSSFNQISGTSHVYSGTSTPGPLHASAPSEAANLVPATSNRRLAPVVAYKIRGHLDTTELDTAQKDILSADLDSDMITRGTAIARASCRRTWSTLHWRWFGASCLVLPLTPPKICAMAAQMKASGYRSFPNFLGAMKDAHVESHLWTDDLERCRKRCVASTQRGIGPARQCREMPIALIVALDLGDSPVANGGPIAACQWATLCCFHLVRGAEAACALASSLTLDLSAKTETWSLPASKTDPTAIGVSRTWGCVCGKPATVADYVATTPCPFHAALVLKHALLHRFGLADGSLPSDLPLFPDYQGLWCAREGFLNTITHFARVLELDCVDSLGRCSLGEHVWRVSGARMLARLNVPQPLIMLLARWGPKAILQYVRDAPLAQLTSIYLDKICNGISSEPPAPSLPPSSLLALHDGCAAGPPSLLAEAILDEPPEPIVARFARNITGTKRVHRIACRQAWERPRPGRTGCGWDYVLHGADLLTDLPSDALTCGKCGSAADWLESNAPLDF